MQYIIYIAIVWIILSIVFFAGVRWGIISERNAIEEENKKRFVNMHKYTEKKLEVADLWSEDNLR